MLLADPALDLCPTCGLDGCTCEAAPVVAAGPGRRPTLIDCPVCRGGLMKPGAFACPSCMVEIAADYAELDHVRSA